jgi:hypothetical protein
MSSFFLGPSIPPPFKYTTYMVIDETQISFSTTALDFLDAKIKDYPTNRKMNDDHVSSLKDSFEKSTRKKIHHELKIAWCPNMKNEDEKWLLMDGQHRRKALSSLSSELKKQFKVRICVDKYDTYKTIKQLQCEFSDINNVIVSSNEEKKEQENLTKAYDEFDELMKEEFHKFGRKVSYIHNQKYCPKSNKWKLNFQDVLKVKEDSSSKLYNKTDKEIIKILKECNKKMLLKEDEYLKMIEDPDARKSMKERKFFLAADFPGCLGDD